jgi:WD40 repeat protein
MRVLLLDPDLADPERVARNLRFAADGRALAAVLGAPDSGRRVVVRFDLLRDTGTVIPDPGDDDEGREDAPDPAVSPDLELVAEVLTGYGGDEYVRLTDTWARPPEDRTVPLPEGFDPTAVEFAHSGTGLLVGVGSADGGAVWRYDVERLLDLGDDSPMAVELEHAPLAVADSPDGRFVAVGFESGEAVLIDTTGDRLPLTVVHPVGRRRAMWGLGFSPDGRRLVTHAAGTLAVWDARLGDRLVVLAGPKRLTGFAFTPDGRHLLASCLSGGVYRWDIEFQAPDRLAPGVGPLHSVAVSPDGLTAAAGGEGGVAAVWDLH